MNSERLFQGRRFKAAAARATVSSNEVLEFGHWVRPGRRGTKAIPIGITTASQETCFAAHISSHCVGQEKLNEESNCSSLDLQISIAGRRPGMSIFGAE